MAEERIERLIKETKKITEDILKKSLGRNNVSILRWMGPSDHPTLFDKMLYSLHFSVAGGREENIHFSYTLMCDGSTKDDPNRIENIIKEKIKSLGLETK